jgi:hypothetical protein
MQVKSIVKPRGYLGIKVFSHGRMIRAFSLKNQVVTAGKEAIARLLAGEPGYAITHIGVGTSGDATTQDMTALTNQVVVPIQSITFPQRGEVQFRWLLPSSTGNDMDIKEFGLIYQPIENSYSLFSRLTISPAISKNSDISLQGTWLVKLT